MKLKIIVLLLLTGHCLFGQTEKWRESHKDSITQLLKSKLTKAMVIYQDGKLVYEYGSVHQNYQIFSIRKSIVSLLYGIYVQENRISLDETLEKLGIDDFGGLTPLEKQAKVIDLLMARSGVYHPAAYETPGMAKNRPTRGQYKPGEHWFYNNWDFNALTTIFETKTKQRVFDAFNERIASKIGLEDFNLSQQKYYYDSLSKHPATLWYMSASDLSKLGLLLLNNGVWKGQKLIEPDWIIKSTSPHSNLGILGGYGYCWWVALNGEHFPFIKLPDATFSARGIGEQSLLVIPSRRLVLVHLTDVKSPNDPMMKVTETGKILRLVLEN